MLLAQLPLTQIFFATQLPGLMDPSSLMSLAQLCPNLQVLDISKNQLAGPAVLSALCQIKSLRVVYTKGNPFTKEPNCRSGVVWLVSQNYSCCCCCCCSCRLVVFSATHVHTCCIAVMVMVQLPWSTHGWPYHEQLVPLCLDLTFRPNVANNTLRAELVHCFSMTCERCNLIHNHKNM